MDLGDLDEKSRKLLEEHAAEMAKKMQALMADTDMSEEGRAARAKKMQELQEESRRKAMEILDADARLKVDQRTEDRELKIATDEIEEALAAIVDAEKNPPASLGFENLIDHINKALSKVSAHVDAHTDADVASGASLLEATEHETQNAI